MNPDPTAYILAAALISGSIGFFSAAILCARTVKRANIEAWKEARIYFHKLYGKTPTSL